MLLHAGTSAVCLLAQSPWASRKCCELAGTHPLFKRRRLLLRCGVRPCGAGHGDGGSATGSERDDFSIDFMSKGQRAARQPNLPHSAWR